MFYKHFHHIFHRFLLRTSNAPFSILRKFGCKMVLRMFIQLTPGISATSSSSLMRSMCLKAPGFPTNTPSIRSRSGNKKNVVKISVYFLCISVIFQCYKTPYFRRTNNFSVFPYFFSVDLSIYFTFYGNTEKLLYGNTEFL